MHISRPTRFLCMSNLVLKSSIDVEQLLSVFLSGRKKTTLLSYSSDLTEFTKFLGVQTIQDAALTLIGMGQAKANLETHRYRSVMMEQGLASSTINRRLSALRSLLKLARTFGLINWSIETGNLPSSSYRDTSGPGLSIFKKMVQLASSQRNRAKAARDVAIFRLMFDLGLRVSEITALEFADVNIESRSINILAKGRREKMKITLPIVTVEAIKAWINVRALNKTNLFYNLDRQGNGERITRRGIHKLVVSFSIKAGRQTWPHGIRHLSITEACKAAQENGIPIEEILTFSRHKSLSTLLIYRDQNEDIRGRIAELVAQKL